MKKIILTYVILLVTTGVLADDVISSTETCANGAGTVITGAVSEHKYCMSNQTMNWWNAYTWCDGQGRRMLNLETDCQQSGTAGGCPDLSGRGGSYWKWSVHSHGVSQFYSYSGVIGHFDPHTGNHVALCY